MNLAYDQFLETKRMTPSAQGFDPEMTSPIFQALFPFQRALVEIAVRRGRCAVFADTGLGKTVIQLAWADEIQRHTNGRVLIVAPLAVSWQTQRESVRFSLPTSVIRSETEATHPGIYITNYEMINKFNLSEWTAVVLDEASILKHLGGKLRQRLIDACQSVPYRLSCTATPAPNDYMEFGGQCEFLGVMTMPEMLATYFTHDGGNTSKWRLKGHGRGKFYEWMASWAVLVKHPRDIGFDETGFDLPALAEHHHQIASDVVMEEFLFPVEAQTLTERLSARRDTIEIRCRAMADRVNADSEPWLVWCHLNDESDMLGRMIPDAVTISGSDALEIKEARLLDFAQGRIRVLVTKPSIAGFGLNFQHCARVGFVGLSDSYESYYQGVRRCWRYGQTRAVEVHTITADIEGAVLENLQRKARQADDLQQEMIGPMAELTRDNIKSDARITIDYDRDVCKWSNWELHLGDCVDVTADLKDNSVGLSIFSPPFSSLYTYSASERDMGNAKSHGEFADHFRFLASDLFRVMMPGRHVCIHCFNIPLMKERDGVIGLKDFRGEIIRLFQDCGFVYHSEVVIWKDPVTQMQRTKALGLLHKTIRKDSSMSRMGLPDYVVVMRKSGDNPEPIPHDSDDFPVSQWQRWASPIWNDIEPNKTLNRDGARENDDERHIAPLQLDVIERCITLWSNEGDLIYSPFAGIGSEGYMAVRMGRRFVGAELKRSYWDLACRHLSRATSQTSIFDALQERE